jgi:hypothetical protein
MFNKERLISGVKPASDDRRELKFTASQAAHILRRHFYRTAETCVIMLAAPGAVILGKARGAYSTAGYRAFLIFFPVKVFLKDIPQFILVLAHETLTQIDIPRTGNGCQTQTSAAVMAFFGIMEQGHQPLI